MSEFVVDLTYFIIFLIFVTTIRYIIILKINLYYEAKKNKRNRI